MKNRSKHVESAGYDENSQYDSDSNASHGSSGNSNGSNSNATNNHSVLARQQLHQQQQQQQPTRVLQTHALGDSVVLAFSGLGRAAHPRTLDLSINASSLATSNVLLTRAL